MPEANQILYTFKELAALMVKEQGLTEGYWGVYVRFGIGAANAGPSDSDLKPTALVPIVEMGLQRFQELNNLSVDAAVVNPKLERSASAKAVASETRRTAAPLTRKKSPQ